MRKVILVDFNKCTGCSLCGLACSLVKTDGFDLARSRISIVKVRERNINLPMVCFHCSTPVCQEVCPTHALKREEGTGVVKVDEDLCIGCHMCSTACPLGGVGMDGQKGIAIKCDLCAGDPTCIKYCGYGAIDLVELDSIAMVKRRTGAKKLSQVIEKIV